MDNDNAFADQTTSNPFLIQSSSGGDDNNGGGGGGNFNYPSHGIDYPGMNDVMCGRGGGTNNHIGNIRFRQLVNEHKLRYLAASKVDKPRVAMEVVQIWRKLEPPGRFLTKSDVSQGDDSLWHDVGDKKAREKASQCLRERTPDVMPFVKQLQEQEKGKKEKKRKDNGDSERESARSGKSSARSGPRSARSSDRSAGGRGCASDRTDDTDASGHERMASLQHHQDANFGSMGAKPDFPVSSNPAVTQLAGGGSDNNDSGRRRKKTREEVANSIPTAAALMDEFDDHSTGGGGGAQAPMSMEAYQQDVEAFLDSAPKGDGVDEYSVADRSLLMETLSTCSWVKSFKSLDTTNSNAMIMASGATVQDNLENTTVGGQSATRRKSELSETTVQIDNTNPQQQSCRPALIKGLSKEASTRSQKLAMLQGASQMSMLSDLTDYTAAGRNKSTRSMKMSHAADMNSGKLSMMSEMSNLSDELKQLGLTDMELASLNSNRR